MNDTDRRIADADLEAVRAWTAAERAAARRANARTVAHAAVAVAAAAAAVRLLAGI